MVIPGGELLALLRAEPGRVRSGAELAQRLGVTRAAVWKQVCALRRAGYAIDGAAGRGYTLLAAPDLLLPEELGWPGPVHHFASIGSTNEEARRLAAGGAAHGTVVVAERQTSGRGRRGRAWESAAGGIYLSLLLRPGCHPAEAPRLTLAAAVAVCEGVEEVTGLTPRIKWPNDVLLGGRKLCGILLELAARDDAVEHVVLGVGLNVNNPPPAALPDATSLAAELGHPVDRAALCRTLLGRLAACCAEATAGSWPGLLERWRARCETLGRWVRVTGAAGSWEGRAAGVDEDGALLLELADGGRRRLLAGEVTLRGPC